jgi:hypothetical protein
VTFDPTIDLREAILVQFSDLLDGISGIKSNWRNRRSLKDVELPATDLLDGDEDVISDVARLKRPGMPPVITCMKPQVFLGIRARDNVDNMMLDGVLNPAGTELNSWRMILKAAIENDPGLLDLVTPNGGVYYRGCLTDMKVGRSIGAYGAQLQLNYEIYYPLFPPR